MLRFLRSLRCTLLHWPRWRVCRDALSPDAVSATVTVECPVCGDRWVRTHDLC